MVAVVQRLERQVVILETPVRFRSVTLIWNVTQVLIDRPFTLRVAGAWFVPAVRQDKDNPWRP